MSLDFLVSDPGRSVAPAIDRAVLGHWLNGDDAAVDALLGVFLDSICDDAVRMRDLLALDDLKQFAAAAHRLRGAALSMGARTLADFVHTLYAAAQTRDRESCADGMPTLAAHVQLVVDEVPGYAPPVGI